MVHVLDGLMFQSLIADHYFFFLKISAVERRQGVLVASSVFLLFHSHPCIGSLLLLETAFDSYHETLKQRLGAQ